MSHNYGKVDSKFDKVTIFLWHIAIFITTSSRVEKRGKGEGEGDGEGGREGKGGKGKKSVYLMAYIFDPGRGGNKNSYVPIL